MKKIILLFILILLCGCTSEYNLEINNNSFKEDINVIIPKNMIPEKTNTEVEIDDPITPFIEGEQAALLGSEDYYKKNVEYLDDNINVNLKYTFDENDFENSNTLNLCFQNHKFTKKDTYYLHLSGEFYCLYADNLKINIKTDNKVLKNNADEVNGNIYTWNINYDEIDNVDIEFEVEKGVSTNSIVLIVSIVFIFIFVLSIIYLLNKRNKENNKI